MAEEHKRTGSAAVDAALARARRHLATASVAAVLVPLSAMSAHAVIAVPAPPPPTIAFSSPTGFGVLVDQYSVTNTNGVFFSNLLRIELPEIHAGDLNFNFNANDSGSVLPIGWTATEFSTPQIPGTSLKSGTATAYVDLVSATGLAPGLTINFLAAVPTLATTNSNFEFRYANGTSVLVDPPIPNTGPAAVPEPATLSLLGAGLLGLLGFKRRRAV